MKYLVKKELGIDEITGLNQRVIITQFMIDAASEKISIQYKIETLSPTGVVVKSSNPLVYTRYNRVEVLDENGNVVKEANMKFNQLKDSTLGQTILGMLQTDIDGYPDLAQD